MNIYAEDELDKESTCAKFALAQTEGNRKVSRLVEVYNLDMADWLRETDHFLQNNRRKVLEGKGTVSHEDAVKKAEDIYEQFRVQQDRDYISQFDKVIAKYLKGGGGKDE